MHHLKTQEPPLMRTSARELLSLAPCTRHSSEKKKKRDLTHPPPRCLVHTRRTYTSFRERKVRLFIAARFGYEGLEEAIFKQRENE